MAPEAATSATALTSRQRRARPLAAARRSRLRKIYPPRRMLGARAEVQPPAIGRGRTRMSATLKSSLFDEPDAAEASAPPKRFKFAATFVIDLVVSLAFVAVVLPCWAADFDRGLIMAPTFVIGVLILVSYAGKVLVIAHLDKHGGDARTYVKSSALVTDGPYAWSRNPTYL